MGPGSPRAASLQVTVIADSRQTIDGLHAYFQGAGVHSHTTRTFQDATTVPPGTTAVVLFPDELEDSTLVPRILALRADRPGLLLVVVTSTPPRLRPALDPDGHSLLPVVLSKPAFGWTILDAIREHAHAPAT